VIRPGIFKTAVVLTAFNHSRYTRRALESLCRSTPNTSRYRFEFAVFDDCSIDDTALVVNSFGRDRVAYWCSPQNSGVTYLWNEAYRQYAAVDYLSIVNNDVVFTPNWCVHILDALTQCGCALGGPVTNGPGHVSRQDVRNFIPGYEPSDAWEDLLGVCKALSRRKPFSLDRINGFCMVFDLRLLIEAQENRPGEPFDPANRNFGNEDEIQRRLKPRPVVVPRSFVFHYKRVSIADGGEGYVRYRPTDVD
jgi:glycosyltransferase involved in cell wall biosynthesis